MGRWDTSDRRTRLPKDWPQRRQNVFKRDGYRCTWMDIEDGRKVRCEATDNLECDHIIRGDDHSLENLRTLCTFHHAIKTNIEGHEALAAKRREIKQRFRRTEKNPGLHNGPGKPYTPPWAA